MSDLTLLNFFDLCNAYEEALREGVQLTGWYCTNREALEAAREAVCQVGAEGEGVNAI